MEENLGEHYSCCVIGIGTELICFTAIFHPATLRLFSGTKQVESARLPAQMRQRLAELLLLLENGGGNQMVKINSGRIYPF